MELINQDNKLSDEEYPISDEESDVEDFDTKKSSFASSIAKILKNEGPEKKQTLILSKAKKVEDIEKKKKEKSIGFEIVGDVKQETNEDTKPDEEDLKIALQRKNYLERKKNREKVFSLRIKPSYTDLDRERTFRKIATRGVVQLFNAVKQQQTEINQKVKSTKLDSKKDEIKFDIGHKKKLLEKLMSAKSELVDNPVKKEEMKYESSDEEDEEFDSRKKSKWGALKEDFMTTKNAGWDKDSDSSNGEDQEMESESE